jgi:hypothetical protein
MLIDYAFVSFSTLESCRKAKKILLSLNYKQVDAGVEKLCCYEKLRYRNPMDKNPEDSDFAIWYPSRVNQTCVVEILNHNGNMRAILNLLGSKDVRGELGLLPDDGKIEEGFNLAESAPELGQINLLAWVGEHPKIRDAGYEDVHVTSIRSTKSGPIYDLFFKMFDDYSCEGFPGEKRQYEGAKYNECLVPQDNELVVRQRPNCLSVILNRDTKKAESFSIVR